MTLEAVELRADEEKRTLTGYAAVFNARSNDMGFYEVIKPGAFTSTLSQDVPALFNHDSNYVMGRTSSGTLRLEEDEKGLRFEVDVPNTTWANDLLVSIQRGDIKGCSFAFSVAKGGDTFERDASGKALRTISKVERLYDVSPAVTNPAYKDTSVSLRSLIEERGLSDDEKQALSELIEDVPADGNSKILADLRLLEIESAR